MRFHVVVSLLVSSSLLTSCATDECVAIGCSNGAEVDIDVGVSASQLDGGRLRLCLGASCTEIRLDANGASMTYLANDLGPSLPLEGSRVRGNVSRGGIEAHADGDIYLLEVFDAQDTLVTSRRWVADYEDAHAGGYECAPVCRSTTLDATNLAP